MATRLELPKFQALDSNGDPLSGGLLYTYEAGTTTNKTTYTDRAAGTPNANPVVLDSRGEASVYASGSIKFVLKDSAGATIWTVDNLLGINESDFTTMGDYNSDFDAAITAIGATATTLYVDTASTMSGVVTVPATCAVIIQKGGSIDMGGNALTFNGPLIMQGGTFTHDAALVINKSFESGWYDLGFDSTQTLTFGANAVDRVVPIWWGENTTPGTTDMTAETQAAFGAGIKHIHFPQGIYLIPDGIDNTYGADDLKITGEGMSSVIKVTGASKDGFEFKQRDNLIISDLQLDISGASGTSYGIHLHGCTDVWLTRLYATAPISALIGVRDDSGTRSARVIISEVQCYDSGDAGIYIYNTDYFSISDSIFAKSNTSWNISIQECNYGLVTNNVIFNDDSETSNGIGLTSEDAAGTDNCTYIDIIGNNIYGCQKGIAQHATNIKSEYCSIVDNTIAASTIFGIDVNTWNDCDILNNRIYTVSGGSATDGIKADTCNRLRINGNRIMSAARHGINLVTVVDSDIHDNYIKDCGDTYSGIYLQTACTGNSIKHNRAITSVAGTYQDYGINISDAGSLNNTLSGNEVDSNPTPIAIHATALSSCPVFIDNNANETVTAAAPTIQSWGATSIDSTNNAVNGTLGTGQHIGQIKTIVMIEASNSSTISITNHQTSDPEVATFNAVDETGVFMWTGTEWITIFATCTFV